MQGESLKGYKHLFDPALREAGISFFAWYRLRHKFASRLVMAGVELRTVAELMGHKTIQMTMRYAHLAPAPRRWRARMGAREKRAFVSSVMAELAAERQAAAARVRGVGLRAFIFEEFGGREAEPEEAYLAEVEGSDIYVGILGKRYGKPLKSRFSATHAEYLHAEKHALRMAVWTALVPDREGHEQSFLDEVLTFHVVPSFRTADDLPRQGRGQDESDRR